jgi:hypothetical protein
MLFRLLAPLFGLFFEIVLEFQSPRHVICSSFGFRALSLVRVISPIEQIDFHFEAVCVKPPVSHMAAALVPTFCSLHGTFGAPCATDHNALLEALVRMTIDAEQAFEKNHSISGHGDYYLRSHRRQWVGRSGMGRLARTSRQPDPSRRQGNTNA